MSEIADDLFEAPADESFDEASIEREFAPTPEADVNVWPPVGASLIASGVVVGEPRPAGSKKAFINKRTGRPIITDDTGSKGKTWRADIRDAVLRLFKDQAPLDEPLALSIVFFGERPGAHYGTGRNAGKMKDTAPLYPHSSKLPDGTKLARAFEDALNKLVWKDDRRFVDFRWSRRYGSPRAEWHLYRLPGRAVEVPREGAKDEALPGIL